MLTYGLSFARVMIWWLLLEVAKSMINALITVLVTFSVDGHSISDGSVFEHIPNTYFLIAAVDPPCYRGEADATSSDWL